MGVQAMIKGALAPVKKSNTSNARALKELDRRVTDIAADLERSPDAEKTEKFKRIVNSFADGFDVKPKDDSLAARLEPVVFAKRQELILNTDKELNEIKAPAPGREETMNSATMKDYRNLDHEIKKLSGPVMASLAQINALLPDNKTMQDPDACQRIQRVLAEQSGINDLQKAMAKFSYRVEKMKEKGILNPDILVTIYKVEDPDSDPVPHTISGNRTFGELADDFIFDDVLPDFWIRKVNPEQNCVTATNHWWEFQDADVKVGEAFPGDNSQQTHRVELIAREGDYIVALLHDNGMEKCHPVELSKKRQMARDYLPCVFKGRKVNKMLKLKDGSDVSEVSFDRRSFKSRTNPIYVEFENGAAKS